MTFSRPKQRFKEVIISYIYNKWKLELAFKIVLMPSTLGDFEGFRLTNPCNGY
jgi:hypothetical protein